MTLKKFQSTVKPVQWLDDIIIFYDKPLHSGRSIEGGAIKPNIVVWKLGEKWAKIIEVSVPNDFGLNRAEREKVNKY